MNVAPNKYIRIEEERTMKTTTALSLYLENHPKARIVESYSNHCLGKVMEFWDTRQQDVTIIGRNRHGLHTCWVIKEDNND